MLPCGLRRIIPNNVKIAGLSLPLAVSTKLMNLHRPARRTFRKRNPPAGRAGILRAKVSRKHCHISAADPPTGWQVHGRVLMQFIEST